MDNPRAVRCYEKCGFAHEGLLRQESYVDGKYRDVFMMALLRADYDAAARSGSGESIIVMESNSVDRLHRAGDRQTLKLTHYGRKTGNPYEVVIWYLVEGDKLYLVSANANRSWVRNVKSRDQLSRCASAKKSSTARSASSRIPKNAKK